MGALCGKLLRNNYYVLKLGIYLSRFLWILLIFSTIPVIFTNTAKATADARLYLSPSSGSYKIGDSITTSIFVDSGSQSINAAEATINFPSDVVEFVSISVSGSVFKNWTNFPSNSSNSISFGGGLPTPGYTGRSGKIFTITFKAKTDGIANISINSAQITANDGKGTNVFGGTGSAVYKIGAVTFGPTPKVAPSSEPTIPNLKIDNIYSSTHPNSQTWYSNNSPKFEWTLPSGATGVSLVYDKNPNTVPGTKSAGLITSYLANNLDDGVWYLHLRPQNSKGWGQTSHFKFQIDTQKPEELDIKAIQRDDATEPRVKLSIEASDKASGIDKYEVQLDSAAFENWNDDGSHIFYTPPLDPGDHKFTVRVTDKAGNTAESTYSFSVAPLNTPSITEYPLQSVSSEFVLVKGTTSYPFAQVVVYLQKGNSSPERYIVDTDENGNFIFNGKRNLEPGNYNLWVEVVDKRGAKSHFSDKVSFNIKDTLSEKFSDLNKTLIIIIILLILFIIFLLFLLLRKRNYSEPDSVLQVNMDSAENIKNLDLDPEINMQIENKDTANKDSKKVISLKHFRRVG